MSTTKAKNILFLSIITVMLLATSLVDLAVAQSNSKPIERAAIPVEIGGWKGTDVIPTISKKDQVELEKIYKPLDVKLTWRRYTTAGQPWVDACVQQATNYENLHDVYECMDLAGYKPKRLGVVYLDEAKTLPASLFLYDREGTKCCALYCFQSQAISAIYPAQNVQEKILLTMVGRVPCRLVQLNTRAGEDEAASIARLQKVARLLCSQPI